MVFLSKLGLVEVLVIVSEGKWVNTWAELIITLCAINKCTSHQSRVIRKLRSQTAGL